MTNTLAYYIKIKMKDVERFVVSATEVAPCLMVEKHLAVRHLTEIMFA
jgi:hypothetical protein